MPRAVGKVIIESMKTDDLDGIRTYSLIANDMKLEVKVPLSEINSENRAKTLELVNNQFIASLQIIKHHGHMKRNPTAADLNVWSQTEWGVAIKPKNDPIKEYARFV
tara:strand:+ start:110 stop:430 length:321 start_codon:yes stop_codon:yes gene_type:complete